MKKNMSSALLGHSVLLIGMFLLVTYQPALAADRLPAGVDAADRKFYDASESAPRAAPAAVDPADRKFFYATETAANAAVAKNAGRTYAMDPVDMKLFDAAEISASSRLTSGVVYAMDAVDLKLFDAAAGYASIVAGK